MVAGLFAYVNSLGRPGDAGKDPRPHQPVVNHHFRLGEQFLPFYGKETRIPGACPHQPDFAGFAGHFPGKADS